MSYNPELVEKVFKPGNLVHGASNYDFVTSTIHGIQPPREAFSKAELARRRCATPNYICFALLSADKMPERYFNAWHEGPYGFLDAQELAYIINGQKAQLQLKGEIFAIGSNFQDMMDWEKYRYGYMQDTNSVFGFPIKRDVPERDSYVDEVRVYPKDFKNISLKPDTWEGIIVRESLINDLRRLPVERMNLPKIPVFTKDFRVVTEDWRELIAA